MVDLHSHALFGMDDGAQTIEDSIAILKRAQKIGIKKMALTPHFTIGDDVKEFCTKRSKHFEILKQALWGEKITIDLTLGAEVYITDEIFNETELKKLTIGESDVILAEFKYHGLSDEKFAEYIEEILKNGCRVLVAHPERYSYLNSMLVKFLQEKNVMLQANAISFFEDSPEGATANSLLRNNVVYCIGSDIHHARSKRLDAMERIFQSSKAEKLVCSNPKRIFDNLI